MKISIFLLVVIVLIGGFLYFRSQNTFPLPEGETTTPLGDGENTVNDEEKNDKEEDIGDDKPAKIEDRVERTSVRSILETDGVRHSIPLNEILSGGVPRDGIPSIDEPKFQSISKADEELNNSDPGLGIEIDGHSRFYPYNILVWHEIVNDEIAGKPVVVTYCPLCATGVVFNPVINGERLEFGVSGMLWQSNLLMYNRNSDPEKESLWSQVLGEAVLGSHTGEKLEIIRSDTVTYGEWKKNHPATLVLSRDTGAFRNYGRDPYGDYYTNNDVGFGASFRDKRLHPKAYVLGVEINGKFKAYHEDAIGVGRTTDQFENKTVVIQRDSNGSIQMNVDNKELPYIGGFWFSWLAVHPDSALFK